MYPGTLSHLDSTQVVFIRVEFRLPSQEMPGVIGRRLSHYDIVADLGAGGMGVVYRAHDTRLNRDVAIKVLPADRSVSTNARLRFQREALAASALNHPNIITIYEVNSDNGTDFIVMEYVRGTTLLSLLRKRRELPIDEALRYCLQIADAVSKAHAAGIIHRDLKPGNIMVTPDGLVKVLDFGLAKIDYQTKGASPGDETQVTLTQPGMTTGTVAYMSPEQARGDQVDIRSDIFSFGIVMFEILSGQLPFTGQNSMALLHNLHFSPPRDLTALRPDLPPQLVGLISWMLQKDPDQRVQTMAEVVSALRMGMAGVSEGPVTWRSGDTRLSGFIDPKKIAAKKRARNLWLITGTSLALLIVAFAGWHFYPRSKAAPLNASPAVPADDNAFALYGRARQYLELNDRAGNVDAAISLLQKAVQLDPQSAASYAALGEAYCYKNRDSADPQWIKLASDNAEKAVALDGDLAEARISLGRARLQSGDSNSAQSEFQKAIQLDPKNPAPHRDLGSLYAKLGDDKQADEEFQRAVQLNPQDWRTYLEMGVEAYQSGRYKEAASLWEHVLKIEPDEVRTLINLGAVYHALGRDDDAASALQHALAIKPAADTFNNLGTIRYYQGHYDEAAAAFEKTVALNANDASSWANLGDAYRQSHDAAKAKQSYQQAIQLVKEEIVKHPEQMSLRADLSMYLAKSGDSSEALQTLQPILQSQTKDPTNLFEIAIALELCGERAKALDVLAASVKAGQSVDDIKNEPELVSLRADPRYHLNVLTATAK